MDSDNEHNENLRDEVGDRGVRQQGRRERRQENGPDPNEENDSLMDSDNEHNENLRDEVGDRGVRQQGRRERRQENGPDPNEAQGQRRRIILEPFDNSVNNNVVF